MTHRGTMPIEAMELQSLMSQGPTQDVSSSITEFLSKQTPETAKRITSTVYEGLTTRTNPDRAYSLIGIACSMDSDMHPATLPAMIPFTNLAAQCDDAGTQAMKAISDVRLSLVLQALRLGFVPQPPYNPVTTRLINTYNAVREVRALFDKDEVADPISAATAEEAITPSGAQAATQPTPPPQPNPPQQQPNEPFTDPSTDKSGPKGQWIRLFECIMFDGEGNEEEAMQLIKAQPALLKTPLTRRYCSITPLLAAFISLNVPVATALISMDGVDIDACDEDGMSALHWLVLHARYNAPSNTLESLYQLLTRKQFVVPYTGVRGDITGFDLTSTTFAGDAMNPNGKQFEAVNAVVVFQEVMSSGAHGPSRYSILYADTLLYVYYEGTAMATYHNGTCEMTFFLHTGQQVVNDAPLTYDPATQEFFVPGKPKDSPNLSRKRSLKPLLATKRLNFKDTYHEGKELNRIVGDDWKGEGGEIEYDNWREIKITFAGNVTTMDIDDVTTINEDGEKIPAMVALHKGTSALEWILEMPNVTEMVKWIERLVVDCGAKFFSLSEGFPYLNLLARYQRLLNDPTLSATSKAEKARAFTTLFEKMKPKAESARQRIMKSVGQPTTDTPTLSMMLFTRNFNEATLKEGAAFLGLTSLPVQMATLHSAARCADFEAVKSITTFFNLEGSSITNGVQLEDGTIEYVGVLVSMAESLEILRYLIQERKYDIRTHWQSIVREDMRVGDVDVSTYAVDVLKLKTLGHEWPSSLGCPKHTHIPTSEEIKYCLDNELVSDVPRLCAELTSSAWSQALNAKDGGSGPKTAIIMCNFLMDFCDVKTAHSEYPDFKPLKPNPDFTNDYLDEITTFLAAVYSSTPIDWYINSTIRYAPNHDKFKGFLRNPRTGEFVPAVEEYCTTSPGYTYATTQPSNKPSTVTDYLNICGINPHLDVQSAFFEEGRLACSDLHNHFKKCNVEKLIIVGLELHSFVTCTAMDALSLGYDVTVVKDISLDVRRDDPKALKDLTMLRDRGVRLVSVQDYQTKETSGSPDGTHDGDDKPTMEGSGATPVAQQVAIREMLQHPKTKHKHFFDKNLGFQCLHGFDFQKGPRNGELFLYVANLVSTGTKYPKGFTFENVRFESGDYQALTYPLHYLLMKTRFGSSSVERQGAKELLLKVIRHINEICQRITMMENKSDADNKRLRRMLDIACKFPLNPCSMTLDEALRRTGSKRCKCIFHVPLRTYKPVSGNKEEEDTQYEEVREWDLWNKDYFEKMLNGYHSTDAVERSTVERPHCPVGMHEHRCPYPPYDAETPRHAHVQKGKELQHVLCCTPLMLAVRLNLFQIVKEMLCNSASPGVLKQPEVRGRDRNGVSYMIQDWVDIWQAMPKDTATTPPVLHYALRALRRPAIEHIPSLESIMGNCVADTSNGRKVYSTRKFLQAIRNKVMTSGENKSSSHDGNDTYASSEGAEDDDEVVMPMPIQDSPSGIAKGYAAYCGSGTTPIEWTIDDALDVEEYARWYFRKQEKVLADSTLPRKVVWAMGVERQWVCACCGCQGNETIPKTKSAKDDSVSVIDEAIVEFLEYQCALRVCRFLIKASSSHNRVTERAGQPVSSVQLCVGYNQYQRIGRMYDRCGIFEGSGRVHVPSLDCMQMGDTGLSLILQCAPQLLSVIRYYDLFAKSPYDSYEEFNGLVVASNACVLLQRRHLWKATRGGVELGVYDKGLSLLHWAALYNDETFTRELIELGANPRTTPLTDRLGYSPIHYACYSASVSTLRLMVDNVREAYSAEEATDFVNLQALPKIVDAGFLTYNQLTNSRKSKQSPIRDVVLHNRLSDPSAWPHATFAEKARDKNTEYKFYGPINTAGETAMHVAASFCHTMCIKELAERYEASMNIRSSLEGFDPHDVANALCHKGLLQSLEDRMLNKEKNTKEQENEEQDNKTLEDMCLYMNSRDNVTEKLQHFSFKYFMNETMSFVFFVIVLTVYGFLLMDYPTIRGGYWSNFAVSDAILGTPFKIDFSKSYAPWISPPDTGGQFLATSADVGSIGDIIAWLKGPLRDSLFTIQDGTTTAPYLVIDNKYRLAGPMRIAVQRVANYTGCEIPESYRAAVNSCYSRLLPSTGIYENKTVVVNDTTGETIVYPYEQWSTNKFMYDALQGWVGWQSDATELTYPTDRGNYIDVYPDTIDALNAKFNSIDKLMDDEVRFVTVYINLYAINLNRFVVANIFFEVPPEGSVKLTSRFNTIRVSRYETALDAFRLFLEVLILLYILRFANEEVVELYYLIQEIRSDINGLKSREADMKKLSEENEKSEQAEAEDLGKGGSSANTISLNTFVRKMKKGFDPQEFQQSGTQRGISIRGSLRDGEELAICPRRMRRDHGYTVFHKALARLKIIFEHIAHHYTSDFNMVDAMVLFLLAVCVAYHLYMFNVEASVNTASALNPDRSFLYQFTDIAYFQEMEQKVFAFVVLVAWIKSLKYVRFLPEMGPIASAMTETVGSRQIGTFVVVLTLVIMSFVFCCFFAFQRNVDALRTFRMTFFMIIRTIVGDFNYDALNQGSLHMGPFIFFLFISLVVIMLMNILIAVVGNVYDDLIKETVVQWSMDVSEKYREDVLGLPSIERPYGSIFIQQVYRLLGCCWPRFQRTYEKNKFDAIKASDRYVVDKSQLVYNAPHLRKWDCVSTNVCELMQA
eukprot:PhF_6_TR2014/c1_g2_i1/m.3456